MGHADLEAQLPLAPRKTFIRRWTLRSIELLDDLHSEEKLLCRNLMSLLVGGGGKDMSPSLDAACDWYRSYLKISIEKYWPLIRAALRKVEKASDKPSRRDFAIVIAVVHEVATQLVSVKDVALCDIVDPLVNAKHFRPELEVEDDWRVIPNKLVLSVVGWLLLLYEVPLEQNRHRQQIGIRISNLTSFSSSRSFRDHNPGLEYNDNPLHKLLSEFGDVIPDVKPEVLLRRPSLAPPSENIHVQLVCYGTAWHLAQLEIEWVDHLSQHLELDAARRTLRLFRFPSYCRMMCHERNIHRQLLTDHAMSQSESDKEPLVRADAFFREILLTYRVLFGQDERSFRAFQRGRGAGRDAHHQAPDPLLPVLCGRSWTMPEARDLYGAVDPGGAVRDTYDSNADFPIMGQKLLALQTFVRDYHPKTLTALLTDRRDPTAWYNFWTNQTLLLFACLAILINLLQLAFQVWQVVLGRQQLAQNPTPSPLGG